MKFQLTLLVLLSLSNISLAQSLIREVVYVESPTDTDGDGKPDRIYVSIDRPNTDKKVSTIYHISPYALGGTEVAMHNVEVDLLPQDEAILKKYFLGFYKLTQNTKNSHGKLNAVRELAASRYARISAHSLGTGYSTGCPTVGDSSETLAAKAVIDWLNGSAKAYNEDDQEVLADWSNGSVGMTGTSYDGTLPIMVATTGVKGLKAIVPIAAISNWYDYYRANGLVVNPGGYIGEDADILGYYIVRKNACHREIEAITKSLGRESGDFTPFWQKRNYVPLIKNIKAATFIIHGQSDWNVKQKHAIQLWESLAGIAPRRIFLHKGGHGSTYNHNVPKKLEAWFDHFLEGDDNGITDGPQVEVELPNGDLVVQEEWPHEGTTSKRFYFSSNGELSTDSSTIESMTFVDEGSRRRVGDLIDRPSESSTGRLVFLLDPFKKDTLVSGTSQVSLELAVMNRKAANITAALVEYNRLGSGKIITRGWADPQNAQSIKKGKFLVPGKSIRLKFNLEPKEYRVSSGNRLGVVIMSTDHEYNLRPKEGTLIQVNSGETSYIDLMME